MARPVKSPLTRVLAMSPAARANAEQSFEDQVRTQMIATWENQMGPTLKATKEALMMGVYEARAKQMEKCHRVCGEWQGSEKMSCLRRAMEKGSASEAEACLQLS